MSTIPRRGCFWERAVISAFIALMIISMLGPRSTVPVVNFELPDTGYLARWKEGPRKIELIDSITWRDFAYSTYATGTEHLCNAVMLMESLYRVGAKADKLLLYTNEWDIENLNSTEARLLRQARDRYGVKVQSVQIIQPGNVKDPMWAAGFTKWLAFNQTQYKRVLTLNSDATILRPLDALFLMPPTPVAMPRAYWLNDSLSAQLALVQPSTSGFQAIQSQIKIRQPDDYDMEIINAVYGSSCAIIPHRAYNLLTGEFRSKSHTKYLGSKFEEWDADAVIQEAKYVHFSDWPLNKPWDPSTQQTWADVRPRCVGANDCAELRIWTQLYEDFRERRLGVCGADFDTWSTLENASRSAPAGTSLGDLAMEEAFKSAAVDFDAHAALPEAARVETSTAPAVQTSPAAMEELKVDPNTVIQVVVVDADGNLQPNAVASEEDIKAKMLEAGLGAASAGITQGEKSKDLEAKMGGLA